MYNIIEANEDLAYKIMCQYPVSWRKKVALSKAERYRGVICTRGDENANRPSDMFENSILDPMNATK